MCKFSNIVDDNIERIKEYYNNLRDRAINRFRSIYEKNKEDAEILENMITSRGYKIIYHEVIEPSIDAVNDNKFAAIHIRKENTHSVVLNYNVSASKKEELNGRLYLSIRHKGGYVAKKDTIKYHYARATNETPFIQIFADTEPEKVDTFFMLIDALTEITTEDDFIRYRDFTCKAAKQNLLMLKSINKLE